MAHFLAEVGAESLDFHVYRKTFHIPLWLSGTVYSVKPLLTHSEVGKEAPRSAKSGHLCSPPQRGPACSAWTTVCFQASGEQGYLPFTSLLFCNKNWYREGFTSSSESGRTAIGRRHGHRPGGVKKGHLWKIFLNHSAKTA